VDNVALGVLATRLLPHAAHPFISFSGTIVFVDLSRLIVGFWFDRRQWLTKLFNVETFELLKIRPNHAHTQDILSDVSNYQNLITPCS
jgi:hypothetical protein